MKKPTRPRIVSARNAVVAFPGLRIAAEKVLVFTEVDKLTDKEVQAPVVVIVEPHGTGGPSRFF